MVEGLGITLTWGWCVDHAAGLAGGKGGQRGDLAGDDGLAAGQTETADGEADQSAQARMTRKSLSRKHGQHAPLVFSMRGNAQPKSTPKPLPHKAFGITATITAKNVPKVPDTCAITGFAPYRQCSFSAVRSVLSPGPRQWPATAAGRQCR